jgi:hypothetical protein
MDGNGIMIYRHNEVIPEEGYHEKTDGFYRVENETFVVYGRLYVLNKGYALYRDEKDTYEYPVDGWRWFDSEDQAYEYFNLEKPSLS